MQLTKTKQSMQQTLNGLKAMESPIKLSIPLSN